MKYLAMCLEILGNVLFVLIGFCFICGIVFLIIATLIDIYHYHLGDTKNNYLSELTSKTFEKYTFTPEDKITIKDKWKDLI